MYTLHTGIHLISCIYIDIFFLSLSLSLPPFLLPILYLPADLILMHHCLISSGPTSIMPNDAFTSSEQFYWGPFRRLEIQCSWPTSVSWKLIGRNVEQY